MSDLPAPTATPPTARARAAAVLLTLVGCAAMLEVGLRLVGRPPTSHTDGIFREDGHGAYRLQPDLDHRSVTRSFTCSIRTNALGFRDRAPGPRRLDRPYVAWMGDSATFANGLDYEDSFVGRFGALAAARGIEVVNLAVGGHHVSEQEDVLREFLAIAPRPPTDVVFVFTPQVLLLHDERYGDLMVRDGYLYPRRGWWSPWLRTTLGNASASYCFFRDAIRRVQARLRPGEVDPAMVQVLARTHAPLPPGEEASLDAKLAELDVLIRRSGARPVFVFLPTSLDLDKPETSARERGSAARSAAAPWGAALARYCASAGVRFIDLTPAVAAERAEGWSMTFAEDPHYVAGVHRELARVLYDGIVGGAATAPATADVRSGGR